MLAKRPSQRQQSADELVAEILGLGQQLGLPNVAQHGQVVVATGGGEAQFRARVWQVAAAAAVLAAAVILTDVYLPTSSSTAGTPTPPHFTKPRLAAVVPDTAPRSWHDHTNDPSRQRRREDSRTASHRRRPSPSTAETRDQKRRRSLRRSSPHCRHQLLKAALAAAPLKPKFPRPSNRCWVRSFRQ